ncbi:hypothetical protein NSP_38870 [Nodularia spumigena CCY9414]|nr:hypothetical protein NSP_38870 [Nodularia spumigena CCY9414]
MRFYRVFSKTKIAIAPSKSSAPIFPSLAPQSRYSWLIEGIGDFFYMRFTTEMPRFFIGTVSRFR